MILNITLAIKGQSIAIWSGKNNTNKSKNQASISIKAKNQELRAKICCR